MLYLSWGSEKKLKKTAGAWKVVEANHDDRAGLVAELEAKAEDDEEAVLDREQDADLKKVTNDCEQKFDEIKTIV